MARPVAVAFKVVPGGFEDWKIDALPKFTPEKKVDFRKYFEVTVGLRGPVRESSTVTKVLTAHDLSYLIIKLSAKMDSLFTRGD